MGRVHLPSSTTTLLSVENDELHDEHHLHLTLSRERGAQFKLQPRENSSTIDVLSPSSLLPHCNLYPHFPSKYSHFLRCIPSQIIGELFVSDQKYLILLSNFCEA